MGKEQDKYNEDNSGLISVKIRVLRNKSDEKCIEIMKKTKLAVEVLKNMLGNDFLMAKTALVVKEDKKKEIEKPKHLSLVM